MERKKKRTQKKIDFSEGNSSSNAGNFSVEVVELSDDSNSMDVEGDYNNSENDNNEQFSGEEENKLNQILVRVASNRKPDGHRSKYIHSHNTSHSLTQELQEITFNSVNPFYRPSIMNLQ
jgi:hypothetical protein